MEGPTSSVRRRAWINSSRQRFTVEDISTQFTSITDDDVFTACQGNSSGCCTGKIENWFLTCRSVSSENADQSFDSAVNRCTDDELNLGADADAVNDYNTHFAGLVQHPSTSKCHNRVPSSRACQKLFLPYQSLGHNSFNSSTTWTSTTSVAEVLQVYSENAEETLFELGFGCEDPQVTARIPPRFLTFPSQAKGINFRLFLDAQLRRIREEDPSLSLASRFRQVQVLTAMANAFYSLYSHVTRTPVQKLPTPEFNFSTPIERMERFRSSIRSDPRSPVDKLKDTVSKMCLYTGSNRDFDTPLPSPNKFISMPDILFEKPRHMKETHLGQGNLNAAKDICVDDQGYFNISTMEELPYTTTEEANSDGKPNSELVYSERADNYQSEECNGRTYVFSFSKPGSRVNTGDSKPLVKTSNEHICPQIMERVHQVPFGSQCGCLKMINTKSVKSEMPKDSLCLESFTNKHPVLTSAESTGPAVNVDKSQALPSSVVISMSSCCCTTLKVENDGTIFPPSKTSIRTNHGMKSQYLSPEPPITKNLHQVHSFELEEVHSAGEEDSGQCETSKTVTPKSSACFLTGEIVRGDSMQSDSSGYADDVPSERQNEATANCTDKLVFQKKSHNHQTTQENVQKSLPKRKHRTTNIRMSTLSSQVNSKLQSSVPPRMNHSQVQSTVSHNKKKRSHSKSKRHTATFPCHRSLSDHSLDPPLRHSALREPGDLRDNNSDTDLSEEENLSHLPCGGPPPQLELRPEVIASEEPTPINRNKNKSKFDFPDFLPPPFNSWSLNQLALFYNMEGRAASRPRPTGALERYMERLLQLEWYQIQTWQDNYGTAHTEPLSSSHKPLVSTSTRLSTPKCILQCQRAFPLNFLSSMPSHCAYIVCRTRNSSCCRPSGSQARPARLSPTQERTGTSSLPKRSYSESWAPLLGCTRGLSSPVRSQGHLKQMEAAGNLRTSVQAVNRLPSTAKDQELMGKDHFTDYRTIRTRSDSEHRKTNTERQHNGADKRRGRSVCRKGRAERRAQQEIKPDAVTAIMDNLPATKYCAVNRRARSKQVEFVM